MTLVLSLLPEKPRMNNILTSQTEPYDLSFSRSYQNLTHLLPSYDMPLKSDRGTLLSLFITSSSSLLSAMEM
ncbi:protein shisa-6-like isoform X1 [Tachysurus ichikawai]